MSKTPEWIEKNREFIKAAFMGIALLSLKATTELSKTYDRSYVNDTVALIRKGLEEIEKVM